MSAKLVTSWLPVAVIVLLVCGAAPIEQVEAAGRLAAARAARAASLEAASAANAALVSSALQVNPGYPAPAAVCCPQPCIIYRHHGPKLCCGCEISVPTILTVNNPCTCCPVDIPVCLPACCTDAPQVCSGQGLLGRTVVTYDWCCGFRVTVRFRHNGDIVVVTHGV